MAEKEVKLLRAQLKQEIERGEDLRRSQTLSWVNRSGKQDRAAVAPLEQAWQRPDKANGHGTDAGRRDGEENTQTGHDDYNSNSNDSSSDSNNKRNNNNNNNNRSSTGGMRAGRDRGGSGINNSDAVTPQQQTVTQHRQNGDLQNQGLLRLTVAAQGPSPLAGEPTSRLEPSPRNRRHDVRVAPRRWARSL